MSPARKLRESKLCSCGRVHTVVPLEARLQLNAGELTGYYWECTCGSTLFVALEPARASEGEVECFDCSGLGRIPRGPTDTAQCPICDGTGLLECDHSDRDAHCCLICGFELGESDFCRAYDRAKALRQYGEE